MGRRLLAAAVLALALALPLLTPTISSAQTRITPYGNVTRYGGYYRPVQPYYYGYRPYYPYGYYYPGYYGYAYPPNYTSYYYPPTYGPAYSTPGYTGPYTSSYAPVSAPVSNTAEIDVRLPADAQLAIEGVKTNQTGAYRQFISPPLEPGHRYVYHVRATWMVNGKEVSQEQTLTVQAGAKASITFLAPVK